MSGSEGSGSGESGSERFSAEDSGLEGSDSGETGLGDSSGGTGNHRSLSCGCTRRRSTRPARGPSSRTRNIRVEFGIESRTSNSGCCMILRGRPRRRRVLSASRTRYAFGRASHSLDVDPSDPSEVERVAVKYMRKQVRLFDTELNSLTPRDCFEAATAQGSNTILLIPETEINISEQLENSVPKPAPESEPTQEESRKRGRR
ncbi:uncharacterized protein BDZ99DRAFT_496279 [Mytilinidion resinicola]|uniref:Uncharacterized protein n=1 Tax=Mytilinidion resinicola TaxID=574789 RepID=A0A6A6YXL4_9PEZI|nr:uncharacterized protein BDZ99DRAFT_496279 [Mytilinidion resinicola]KAF2813239.1 hypothetical protein BDZ99DRAFT_496279 [Mytilinidion resinicola]